MFIFNSPHGESFFYNGKTFTKYPTIGLKEVMLLMRQNGVKEEEVIAYRDQFKTNLVSTKKAKK